MRLRPRPVDAAALTLAVLAVSTLLVSVLHGGSASVGWVEILVAGLPLGVLYAFLAWAAKFPCQATPLGRAGVARLLSTHVSAALVTTAVWVGLGRAWTGVLDRTFAPGIAAAFAGRAPLVLALGVVGYWLAVAAHYSVAAARAARAAELRESEARALQRESELRALRQQVSPHFLFNCLNTISALAGADPPGARRACERLAALLRRTLTLGEVERVALDEELRLVEAFLDLEQLRFGGRLRASLEVEPGARSWALPPLLLLPLVENAVTHGIATLLEGGEVRIRAGVASGRLAISIDNPSDGAGRAPGSGNGLGIAHARRRLSAAFGDEATLRTSQDANRFQVDIDIPASSSPSVMEPR